MAKSLYRREFGQTHQEILQLSWASFASVRIQFGHGVTVIEKALYTDMTDRLSRDQSARFQSNERRFRLLKRSQICLGLTLIWLLVLIGGQITIQSIMM